MFKVGSKVEARMPGSRSYFNGKLKLLDFTYFNNVDFNNMSA